MYELNDSVDSDSEPEDFTSKFRRISVFRKRRQVKPVEFSDKDSDDSSLR